jgi:nitronate monooxygenase
MLVVTTPEMIAAAAEAGCLGMLPLGYHSVEKARSAIRSVKKLSSKPFGVNLFAYEKPGHVQPGDTSSLQTWYNKFHLPFFEQIPQTDPYTYYTELIDLIIEERIPAVSFHFGIPGGHTVQKLKAAGTALLVTATCVEEAVQIEKTGVDLIIAQGIEAGGNRGSFLKDVVPQTGLISLLPQIKEVVSLPVIAAGGIMQPSSTAAAFLLGAEGVQLGSAFLCAKESGATNSWKQAVKKSRDTSSVLTNKWSGKWGRCIPTSFVLDLPEKEVYPSPIQQFLTSTIREYGRKQDIEDIQSFWAGQSARFASDKGTKEILEELITGADDLLSRPFSFSEG